MEKYHYFIVDGASVVLPVTPERAAWAGEIGTLLARRGIWAAATYFTEEEQGGQCWF